MLRSANIISGRYLEHGPPANWDRLMSMLPLRVAMVRAHGKFIYFTLSNEEGVEVAYVWNTLGLSGGWSLHSHRHSRVEFMLEDENVAFSLYFYDQRNFGTVKISHERDQLDAKLNALGPTWLSPEKETPLMKSGTVTSDFSRKSGISLSFASFLKIAQKQQKTSPKRHLAVFLMDQGKTAGIGNYILSEILYAVRLHPWAKVSDIDEDVWREIYHAAADIISRSYLSQMETVWRKNEGVHGEDASQVLMSLYDDHAFRWDVYMQKKDPSGRPIERTTGPHKRAIHWVPDLQTRCPPDHEPTPVGHIQ